MALELCVCVCVCVWGGGGGVLVSHIPFKFSKSIPYRAIPHTVRQNLIEFGPSESRFS